MRSALESALCKLPLPKWSGIIQYTEDLNSAKSKGRRNPSLFPASLLSWDISYHPLLPSDWGVQHCLPWFSGLWTQDFELDYTTGFPETPAGGIQEI